MKNGDAGETVPPTPILIAPFTPFRLICRDETDGWSPTLSDINKSTYDYVKLHRATKFFDAHLPKLLPACLGFDGSLIIPFIDDFHNGDLAVEEVNRILASMFIGGIYVESVSPLDISNGTMNLTGYFRYSPTKGSSSAFHHAIGECEAGSSAIQLMEPTRISADDMIEAYNEGRKVLSKLPALSPSIFIGAFTYYTNHQTRESLAHAWIGIEQILEFIWMRIVVEEVKQTNIPKRRRFIESQQWTAAHKIELLHQKQFIGEPLYSSLNVARSARNAFIHKGVTPSYNDSYSALQCLISLLEVASGLNEVTFDRTRLESFLSKKSHSCIPQARVPSHTPNEPIDVKWWRYIKVIPGDKEWEGDYETFSDIELYVLKKDRKSS